jgi:hypothetical protein
VLDSNLLEVFFLVLAMCSRSPHILITFVLARSKIIEVVSGDYQTFDRLVQVLCEEEPSRFERNP